MPTNYIVKPGDCISSIAFDHGFFYETVWNYPENAQLKKKREDPNTLCPGDVVVVPDKRPKIENRSTGQVHKFQLLNAPAMFRLQLFECDEPRANQSYEFTIDGVVHQGTTDSRGFLEVTIEPNARSGFLVIGPERDEFDISFGKIQPTNEIAGVQSRLTNLGFDCGGESGQMNEETKAALMSFQMAFGLPETGEIDAATEAKFEDLHDSVSEMPERTAAEPEIRAYEPETEEKY